MRSQSNAAAKELRSLLATFSFIRILNCNSKTPISSAGLLEPLRINGTAVDIPDLNRSLLQLRRRGWLKTKSTLHSLTPTGRKALQLATSGLKHLAAPTHKRG